MPQSSEAQQGTTMHTILHTTNRLEIIWNTLVEEILGLHHSFPTTQIEHYDHMAALFDTLKRINTILIDLDRDIWTYISMELF